MSITLAYHTVFHALEAKAGWTPVRRFAAAVHHALNGHVSHQRHMDAGRACIQRKVGEDQIDRLVGELLALDLNPLAVACLGTTHPAKLIEGFNEYNSAVALGVRTHVNSVENTVLTRKPSHPEEFGATAEDLAPCRHATYAIIQLALQESTRSWRLSKPQPLRRLSDVARLLGLEHSILLDASLALEAIGHVSTQALARALGCHPRTLGRRLREHDLTPEMLRCAARLLRALEGMQAGGSLAEVAVQAGFYDQSHMSCAFRSASGMPPGFFKRLLAPRMPGLAPA